MTKINVTDVVTDNATCSTINDMDIDMAYYVAADMASDVAANMASDVADDMAADVASDVAADVDNEMAADVAANMANDVACFILVPFWKWAVTMGQFSAHYKST